MCPRKCNRAWFTLVALLTSCVGATVSEMSGIAGVGELWGLSRGASTALSTVLLLGVPATCTYRQVEVVGVTLGLFEL